MKNIDLANCIMQWLRERNEGELDKAISRMTLCDYELAVRELIMILDHGGKPPNWIK